MIFMRKYILKELNDSEEITDIYSYRRNISWNQLFSDFYNNKPENRFQTFEARAWKYVIYEPSMKVNAWLKSVSVATWYEEWWNTILKVLCIIFNQLVLSLYWDTTDKLRDYFWTSCMVK